MKTITVFYGIFKDGEEVLRIKTINNYPNTPEAIELLNVLVGNISQATQMSLMDGHYFAWDYNN